MEYIILIAIFLVLGTVALKAADVVRNLIHLALLIVLGAFAWYKVMPFIVGDEAKELAQGAIEQLDSPAVNQVEDQMKEQARQMLSEEALEALDKTGDAELNLKKPEIVEDVIAFNKQLQTEFLKVVNQRIEQAKQKIDTTVADVEVPVLPSKEELEVMTDEKKVKITDQVVQFFNAVPKTSVEEEKIDPVPQEDEEPMQLLLQAQFKDEFSVNEAEGKGSIFRLPDGDSILRLEDFLVTAGPDLHVYLSVSPIGDIERGFVDLGPLKAETGNHNYPLKTHASPYKFQSVVIFSKSLMFPYAIAPLL